MDIHYTEEVIFFLKKNLPLRDSINANNNAWAIQNNLLEIKPMPFFKGIVIIIKNIKNNCVL